VGKPLFAYGMRVAERELLCVTFAAVDPLMRRASSQVVFGALRLFLAATQFAHKDTIASDRTAHPIRAATGSKTRQAL
jgi:hypothetical protein